MPPPKQAKIVKQFKLGEAGNKAELSKSRLAPVFIHPFSSSDRSCCHQCFCISICSYVNGLWLLTSVLALSISLFFSIECTKSFQMG